MRWFVLVWGLAVLAIGSPAEAARLTGVEVEARQGETVVRLRIDDGRARPGVHMLSDHRLIVDLPDIEPALSSHRIPGGTPLLERVRIGLHNDPTARTRVVFDLAGPAAYSVEFTPAGLDVVLRSPDQAPAESAPPPTFPAPLVSSTPRVAPEPTASPSPTPSPEPTASPSPTPSPSPEPTASPSPTPSPSPEPTASPSPTPSPSPEPTARPSPTPSPEPSPRTTASARGTASPRAPMPAADDGPAPDDPSDAAAIPSGTVTIDFTEADIRSVIDLVANVGGYDVIFTPEVRGKVTIRISETPWEEALDAILEKKRLRATRHADLILVSPDDAR